MSLRNKIADRLRSTRLFLPTRELYTTIVPRERANRRVEQGDLKRLKNSAGDTLQHSLLPGAHPPRKALIMGMGRVRFIAQEAAIRKAFELAGFRCVVLIPQDRMVIRAYQQLGSDELIFLDAYRTAVQSVGAQWLARCTAIKEVTALKVGEVQCGKYAVSTLMRNTRMGSFDLTQPSIRAELATALDRSYQSLRTAQNVVDQVRPDALVLVDRGYSPSGEFFDVCVERGIPVFTWNAAHKNDTLMLKRYSHANRDVHPSSMSAVTWQALLQMSWSEERSEQVLRELEQCYASGEWYAEVGTQFNKRELRKGELASRLNLDPLRKTAAIFPHIFWDATFFWGADLFDSYEDWFNQTVEAACRNNGLNWIIKVHPANLVKDRRDGHFSEHSEIVAIRRTVGELPEHVKLVPAETDVSTLSLLKVIDCCVTVRGTVGIEAACFGVPVLTAGTGRYDRLGFTVDAGSRKEYLDYLANAHHIHSPTPQQTQLALRYAWGVLFSRPVKLQLFRMRYQRNETADLDIEFNVRSVDGLRALQDLNDIANWINSGSDDYLDSAGQPGSAA